MSSLEALCLVDHDGNAFYWHLPPNRSAGGIPDSKALWDVIWENRERFAGFAHSHPGRGVPQASIEDLTTFQAIEAGLGRRCKWWITSGTNLFVVMQEWHEPAPIWISYAHSGSDPSWLAELRRVSYDTDAL